MKQPSLDVLMEGIDSKYTLVVIAAKRARVLMENAEPDEFKETKPVTKALEEVAEGKITYELVKEGNK
ncbi:MAG: DNA-directed RNA polymerase subunit omega [Peptococcaceae bacterium]|jgi:DNA-directed RNA polymerase subunit omega|nr:DNA-directed RNA polymerase subunit omega [Peptococcaceae bacterium]